MLRVVRIAVLMASALLASPAGATTDHYREVTLILAWPDADAIIVETASFSPEAEGRDLAITWSIQQPPGVEQARITAPYTRRAKLARPRRSTIAADKLDAVVASLREAVTKHRARAKALEAFASSNSLVTLTAQKSCGARAKLARGRIVVTASSEKDAPTVDTGASSRETSCGTTRLALVGKAACFAHGAGTIVTFRTRQGCEGDTFTDSIAWFPTSP